MKKIYVNKADSAANIIGKVIKTSDEAVGVYIARGTEFASLRKNFLLLKREYRASGKKVLIESVDSDVLELAAVSGFETADPFFGKKRKPVSDIVKVVTDKKKDIDIKEDLDDKDKEVIDEEVTIKKEKKRLSKKFGRRRKERKNRGLNISDEEDGESIIDEPYDENTEEDKPTPVKRFLTALAVAALLTIGITLILTALPRVKITLDFIKTKWDFVGTLNVSTAAENDSFINDVARIRGVSFSEKKNLTKSYPATGKDFVERKSTGKITIFNAYSSDKQDLVKTTRFVTPDGKVYRINKDIVVPGAKITDGKIIPSSIEADVTADKPGEKYNIGPVERFRIPGFQGSPKYDSFYGKSDGSMTGGNIGEMKIPTDDDIKTAKDDIYKTLNEATKTQLLLSIPDDMKIIDGAYQFTIVDESVDDNVNKAGLFTITVRGEGILTAFKEDELVKTLGKRVEGETGVDLAVRDYSLKYDKPKVTPDGKELTTSIDFSSEWTQPFDIGKFKAEAQGKNEAELKTLIFSIPGIQSGEISFWPFWVNKVPKKINKIIVDVK